MRDWKAYSMEYEGTSKNGRMYRWRGISDYGDILDEVMIERDGDIEYVVGNGERLDQIAQRVYGDYRLWWVIALRNDIDYPAGELYEGRVIEIPDPSWVNGRL